MSRLRFWSSFSQMTLGSDLMGRRLQLCPILSTEQPRQFLALEDPSYGKLTVFKSLLASLFTVPSLLIKKTHSQRAEIGRIQLNTNLRFDLRPMLAEIVRRHVKR